MTKNGKLLGRGTGQNHFNAKESRRTQMHKRRMSSFAMSNKARSRFLVNMK